MKEIRYLMYGKFPEKKTGFITRPQRPQLERFAWQGYVASLYLLPPAWAGTNRLTEYVRRLAAEGEALWIAPELEPHFPGWRQPLPDPELAAFLLRCQPFRETMVLLSKSSEAKSSAPADRKSRTDRKMETPTRRWLLQWQERFLEETFPNLNGLYLVGAREQELEALLDWLYEQSGLAACVTDRLPDTDGRKTVLVDLDFGGRVLHRSLSAASLYLDLTSDPEKQRIFKEKRTDISYISVRNYLDTAFKARYNAI